MIQHTPQKAHVREDDLSAVFGIVNERGYFNACCPAEVWQGQLEVFGIANERGYFNACCPAEVWQGRLEP